MSCPSEALRLLYHFCFMARNCFEVAGSGPLQVCEMNDFKCTLYRNRQIIFRPVSHFRIHLLDKSGSTCAHGRNGDPGRSELAR